MSPAASQPVVHRRVLRDGVHDAILELLLGGDLAPGSALGIDGLARRLGVSPTPVREALVQLENTGLVARTALKGYRVAPPLGRDGIAHLMDARTVVEVAAVRAAVPVGREVLRELETASRQHRNAAQRITALVARDPEQLDWPALRTYYTADWAFHLTFLRSCGNPYLLDMAERLAPHVHRLRQTLNHGTVDVSLAVAEHDAVLAAARTGDAEAAAAAMAAHLSAVRSRALADG